MRWFDVKLNVQVCLEPNRTLRSDYVRTNNAASQRKKNTEPPPSAPGEYEQGRAYRYKLSKD